jgi:hypothetical protein
MLNLLALRSFQVFVMVLAAIAALVVLMVTHVLAQSQGYPVLLTVIGFGIGVPVSTTP